MKRYLVMALRTPAFDPAVIAPHRAFLDDLRAQGRLESTGAFSDQSGGAYVLLAASMDDAQAIVRADPLHVAGASQLTVYEWNA